MKTTQHTFTYMVIKVADENEFNQVAEKLRGMGYEAIRDSEYSVWSDKKTHILTYKDGDFGIYRHYAMGDPDYTRYTYEQFMQL
jgi:hypothetical protein